MAEGYGISLLLGQDYSWKQAAVDAALGAAGAGLVAKLNTLRRAAVAAEAGGALIEEGKLGYLFGRATGRAHNVERAAENLSHMRRLGATEAEIAEHLQGVAKDASSLVRTYTNKYGTFEVRESLFAGRTGQFAKFESTWQVMEDGTRRFVTAIPFGGL